MTFPTRVEAAPSVSPPGTSGDAPPQARWGLLVVLGATMLLDAVEVSTMIVAAPAAGRALSLSPAGSHWLISGFALGFAAALLPGTQAVARFGRRRVYLAALLVFAVASLAGGLAPGLGPLIATRVVKGVCAALTAPTGLAIIVASFPAGPARERAMAVYTTLGAAGFAAGLLLAGVLGTASWRWTLLFPAPVALALLAAGRRLIPPDGPGVRRGGPLVRPRLLRHRALVRSMTGAAALNGSHIGVMFIVSSHLQDALGWSPLAAAAGMVVASAPLAVAAPLSGRLVARFGTARLIAVGMVGPVVGYALYLRLPWPGSYAADVLPTLVCVAWGFALAFAALNRQATAGVPDRDKADAIAHYQTAVQLAAAVVTPAVAALLARSAPPPGRAGGAALVASYRPGVALVCAVGLIGALGCVPFPRGARRRSDMRTAHRGADPISPTATPTAGTPVAAAPGRSTAGEPTPPGA